MLKKEQRIARAEFADFFKNGKRVHGEYATIVFTPSPTFHASVVVSKKVSKKAVVRNTLRRRVYAQFTSQAKKPSTGVFIVVLKPAFAALARAKAAEEIKSLIVRTQKTA